MENIIAGRIDDISDFKGNPISIPIRLLNMKLQAKLTNANERLHALHNFNFAAKLESKTPSTHHQRSIIRGSVVTATKQGTRNSSVMASFGASK
eukprot:758632-Amphidinium_carterae.1